MARPAQASELFQPRGGRCRGWLSALVCLLPLLSTELCGSAAAAEVDDRGNAAEPIASRLRRRLSAFFLSRGGASTETPPSVRLLYDEPVHTPGPVGAWFNQVSPQQRGANTYFSVLGHSAGFAAFQQVSWFWGYNGRAIFDIWDPGCTPLEHGECPESLQAKVLECGEDALCTRYSGKGSGVHARLHVSEGQDVAYGFMVTAERVKEGNVVYSGYFHSAELGGWTLLAKVQVPVSRGEWYLRELHSFVQPFSARDLDVDRFGEYGPSFVRAGPGSWTQLTEAAASPGDGEPGQDVRRVQADVAQDGTTWRIGVGGSRNSTFAKKQLKVRESSYPKALQEFIDKKHSDDLPSGCKAETCPVSAVNAWMYDNLYWVSFILLILVGFCCMVYLRIQPAYFHIRALKNPANPLRG